MTLDTAGRDVSVRGRQIFMTAKDVVDFLVMVAEAFPEARFFNCKTLRDGYIEEITRQAPVLPGGTWPEVDIRFVGLDWQPRIVPSGDRRCPYRVSNFPRLVAAIRPGRFYSTEIEGIGRSIVRGDDGLLYANYAADGPEHKDGKRTIDKLWRLHRKVVGNRVVPFSLRTGEVAGPEETDHRWHGIDMARQCLTKKDHYLGLWMNREQGDPWGYKPVKVPGE